MIRDMTAAELTAHKREMASAKRFGEKIESHDSGGHLIAYRWQGKLYIAEWSMQPSPQEAPPK